MNDIHTLSEYLRELPGIGPRQAKRIAFFLVRKKGDLALKLADSIRNAHQNTTICTQCQRLYNKSNATLCSICSTDRNPTLLIVPSDTDLDHIEKTDSYNGYYFVLGGTVPILEKEPENKVRIRTLTSHIESSVFGDITEIILAFSANPEGDNTIDYIKNTLSPIVTKKGITISTLGRGLSTGSEIEYADKYTLDNALMYRIKE